MWNWRENGLMCKWFCTAGLPIPNSCSFMHFPCHTCNLWGRPQHMTIHPKSPFCPIVKDFFTNFFAFSHLSLQQVWCPHRRKWSAILVVVPARQPGQRPLLLESSYQAGARSRGCRRQDQPCLLLLRAGEKTPEMHLKSLKVA